MSTLQDRLTEMQAAQRTRASEAYPELTAVISGIHEAQNNLKRELASERRARAIAEAERDDARRVLAALQRDLEKAIMQRDAARLERDELLAEKHPMTERQVSG